MSASVVRIGGKSVRLSNLDKALYPSGFTKAEVVDYYRQIAPVMLPYLKGRPVSFKRFPNGTAGPSFFQKNRPEHAPDWIKSVTLRGREKEDVDYCLIGDLPSLIWAANSAALELHVPLGKAKDPERPDFVVFDLDPGAPATLLDCAKLALRVRGLLKSMSLECFAKSSGSKGIHVYIPLNTATTFEKSRAFGREIATLLAKEDPDHVTATMARNLRGGKVFVDWNQNAPHQTTVCAYSLRAKPEPFASAPLTWKEIEDALTKDSADGLNFTASQVLQRVKKLGDLFEPVFKLKQKLPVKVATPEKRPRSSGNLRVYKAKRDFKSTPEPKPIVAPRAGKSSPLKFCVQKHLASHLHYDFRLEHRGVLLSWAVPKGPSLNPADKRLAMRVEDHPVDYGDFEGVIPTGYGAGVVMLWDRGTWQPEVDDIDAALEKGDLKFSLDGVKLKGSWALIRTRSRGRDDGRSWLLIKHRDHWAGAIDVITAAPLSVKSFGDFPDIMAAEGVTDLPERGGAAGALLAKVQTAARRKAKAKR